MPTTQPTGAPTVCPTAIPTSVPTQSPTTFELSDYDLDCYAMCTYPGSSLPSRLWSWDEWCGFYEFNGCSADTVASYMCVPECLKDCVYSFCHTFSAFIQKCSVDGGGVNSDLKGECLASSLKDIKSNTKFSFSMVLSYLGFSTEEFSADADAQYTTLATISEILGISVGSIVIRRIRSIDLSQTLQVAESTVQVSYTITETLENLGYTKSSAEYAYEALTSVMDGSIQNGRYESILREEGIKIYRTYLFEEVNVVSVEFGEYSFQDGESRQNIFQENLYIVASMSVLLAICSCFVAIVLKRRYLLKKDISADVVIDEMLSTPLPKLEKADSPLSIDGIEQEDPVKAVGAVGDINTMLRSVKSIVPPSPTPIVGLMNSNHKRVYVDSVEALVTERDESEFDVQSFSLLDESHKGESAVKEPKKSWFENSTVKERPSREVVVSNVFEFNASSEVAAASSELRDDISISTRRSMIKLPPIADSQILGSDTNNTINHTALTHNVDNMHGSYDRSEIDLLQRERNRLARRRARESMRNSNPSEFQYTYRATAESPPSSKHHKASGRRRGKSPTEESGKGGQHKDSRSRSGSPDATSSNNVRRHRRHRRRRKRRSDTYSLDSPGSALLESNGSDQENPPLQKLDFTYED